MKHVLIILIALLSCGAMAQEKQAKRDSVPFEFSRQAFIYEMAKKYNDPDMARMALYNLISYNPSNTALMDSLALWYYEYNQVASAALISQDVAMADESDLFATELAAISFERLGVIPKAISFYEKLYLGRNDLGTLYKISFLQKDVKNYTEALSNIDIIIENPEAETVQLIFPVGQNGSQEISLKIAAIRLRGMILEAKGDKAGAKALYDKALGLQPDFDLLQKQIAEME